MTIEVRFTRDLTAINPLAPRKGATVVVPSTQAQRLIAAGYAEAVSLEKGGRAKKRKNDDG